MARAGSTPWTLALMLLLVIVVPTACLMWFLRQAIDAQQLAVRQQFTDLHREQLRLVSAELELRQQAAIRPLDALPESAGGAERFAELVRANAADGAVVLGSDGEPVYPTPPEATQGPVVPGAEEYPDSTASEWIAARALEATPHGSIAAALKYSQLASGEADAHWRARALQSQVRCLARAGDHDAIWQLALGPLADDALAAGRDAAGRQIVADMELLCLSLPAEARDDDRQTIERRLVGRLNNYADGPSTMPSSQRRFIMSRLRHRDSAHVELPTYAAETLSGAYLESRHRWQLDGRLHPTPLADVWQWYHPKSNVVMLWRRQRIGNAFQDAVRDWPLPVGTTLQLAGPDERPAGADITAEAGELLPGWTLSMTYGGPNPFEKIARQRAKLLTWVAVLSILGLTSLTLLVALALKRQYRLANLKTDLVATVSHELKTPLASMRLLIDTLLDADRLDTDQAREYLRMTATENERLTRLIDQFLTFSRLERGKHVMEPRPVSTGDLVDAARQAFDERFQDERARLSIINEAPQTQLLVDPDAMVAVLLNLLDNARKYSPPGTPISLRCGSAGGTVTFAVEDHGIGIAPRSARKVFDRFFQVEQSLAKPRAGCGLGLAIVRAIVQAHHGRVDVSSQPGRGSVFTVGLPILADGVPSSSQPGGLS